MKETDYDAPSFGDALDQGILMHREAHFGGSFPIMIDYYQKEGKGISLEFELSRILELADEEARLGENLAALLLTARDAEEIKKAKDAYQGLRDIYTVKNPKSSFPKLIADLILSEEEDPSKEIEAICKEGAAITPSLLALLKSDDMYNPLFPGYGKAPHLAAICLGKIGDKSAIIALFESLGKGDFFEDEISIQALKAIGEPAKTFLLRVMHGRPINEDNEKAMIALLSFKEDPEVAKSCFEMLKQIDLKQDIALATYLILACEGLKEAQDIKEFLDLAASEKIPFELKNDFQAIIKGWNQVR